MVIHDLDDLLYPYFWNLHISTWLLKMVIILTLKLRKAGKKLRPQSRESNNFSMNIFGDSHEYPNVLVINIDLQMYFKILGQPETWCQTEQNPAGFCSKVVAPHMDERPMKSILWDPQKRGVEKKEGGMSGSVTVPQNSSRIKQSSLYPGISPHFETQYS
jgi:hypothetical protein